jgi:hypothetical protein
MAVEQPADLPERINFQALLGIVENDIQKAHPESRAMATLACSNSPLGAVLETSFDREKGWVSYTETWDGGGKRELTVGAGGSAWDLSYTVNNPLTPTKIVARKDWKGKITCENLPVSYP